MRDLQTWGPLLATLGVMCLLGQVQGRHGARLARGIAALVGVTLAVRYLWWRYTMTQCHCRIAPSRT
jgi:hypothetical protein